MVLALQKGFVWKIDDWSTTYSSCFLRFSLRLGWSASSSTTTIIFASSKKWYSFAIQQRTLPMTKCVLCCFRMKTWDLSKSRGDDFGNIWTKSSIASAQAGSVLQNNVRFYGCLLFFLAIKSKHNTQPTISTPRPQGTALLIIISWSLPSRTSLSTTESIACWWLIPMIMRRT
jgi:hypothetical protein